MRDGSPEGSTPTSLAVSRRGKPMIFVSDPRNPSTRVDPLQCLVGDRMKGHQRCGNDGLNSMWATDRDSSVYSMRPRAQLAQHQSGLVFVCRLTKNLTTKVNGGVGGENRGSDVSLLNR